MADADSFSSALARLEATLGRLEKAAGNLPRNTGANAAVSALEAERHLLKLRHRRLVQSTEKAIADLDALMAEAGGQ
jgi:hypothetical protein